LISVSSIIFLFTDSQSTQIYTFPYTTLFRSLREFQGVLVAPLGGQVEVVVGGVQHVDSPRVGGVGVKNGAARVLVEHADALAVGDRKSTRLNSSHVAISYAVFCLKKKKNTEI